VGFELYIFDLDGTLVDTAEDIAAGVNHALAALGLGSITAAQARAYVGDGTATLLRRALLLFKDAPSEEEVQQAVRMHLDYYMRHLCVRSTLYPGVRETLPCLDGRKAVVTNKPTDASRELLGALGIAGHFEGVFGSDAFPWRKPDPRPLLAVAERCGVNPGECLMVGDGAQDILAGRAAGMATCGAAYGFRGEAFLRRLRPDYLIGRFCELLELAGKGGQGSG